MTLLDYIKSEADRANVEGRETAAKKYVATLKPLIPFFGEGNDMPLWAAITPEWRERYTTFLTSEYPAILGKDRVAQTTIDRHLDSLRTILRSAVAKGLIPNLKIWGTDASQAYSSRQSERRTLKTFNRRNDIRTLLNVATGALGVNPSEVDRVVNHRIGLLLTRFALVGMDLATFSRLTPDDYDGESIFLPHLKVRVRLPEAIKAIIERYKTTSKPYLFSISWGSGDIGDYSAITPADEADNSAATTISRWEAETTAALSQVRLHFVAGFEDLFAQWLGAALETGIDEPTIMAIIRLNAQEPSPEPDSELITAIERSMKMVASDFNIVKSHWFGIKCRGISGAALADQLLRDPATPLTDRDQFYAPRNVQKRERGGYIQVYNDPIIDRLLFINTPPASLRNLQRQIGMKGVFYGINAKDGSGKEFVAIPNHEIERLREALAINDHNRRVLPPDKSVVGTRVRVIGGLYKGFEGIITKVRHTKAQHKTLFVIGIKGLCLLATPTVDPLMVEAID